MAALKVDKSDSEAEAPQTLQVRKGITIPVGTHLEFDEVLLDELVCEGSLPERADDHHVLTVYPPESVKAEPETLSYLELKMAFDNMPDSEREFYAGSLQGARHIFAPLLLQRHPYVGHPPWLDTDGELDPADNSAGEGAADTADADALRTTDDTD